MRPIRWLLAVPLIVISPAASASGSPLSAWALDGATIQDQRTILTFHAEPDPAAADGLPQRLLRLVALPPDAGEARASIEKDGGGFDTFPLRVLSLRGQKLVAVPLKPTGQSSTFLRIEIEHDGSWSAPSDPRLRARDLLESTAGEILGLPPRQEETAGAGAYVIITTPEFADEAQPLADWKRRKGFTTVVATTQETGATNVQIRAWLRNAYDSWAIPPEYVLLLGDAEDIPAWIHMDATSDHYYEMMDGDWLPDLIVGRLPADTEEAARTMVAKTVAFERTPDVIEGDWFVRSLMVAGNYGSTTPVPVIRWCGRQLERIGFTRADSLYYPPWWTDHFQVIKTSIDRGVSFVAYRGWAYGHLGWEPPHFTTDDIPTIENGSMTPVVMSFVCSTGDFAAPAPSFGEVWLSTGSATAPRGAVGFVGATDVWAHTRFDDAMAISFFERLIDDDVRNLGQLTTAGKIRFMEYFPNDLENGSDESVEHYFHTYLLLGDPELNLWKSIPQPMTVTRPGQIPVGSNWIEVGVRGSGGEPIEGARVGLVREGTLLACGRTGVDGTAHISFASQLAGPPLEITVTAADHMPYESTIGVGGLSGGIVAVDGYSILDGDGNGDGIPNPGETLELTVRLRNGTEQTATGVFSELSATDSATVIDSVASFPDIPPGGVSQSNDPFRVRLDPALTDGREVRFEARTVHNWTHIDLSDLVLDAVAPVLRSGEIHITEGIVYPGCDFDFAVRLGNSGHCGTAGVGAALVLDDPNLGYVVDADGTYGSIPVGGSALNDRDPFTLHIADSVPPGARIPLHLELTSVEGYRMSASCAVSVGSPGPWLPTGPDRYGYYAFDSNDSEFPSERPTYQWTEISPVHGGPGTLLIPATDHQSGSRSVALPFTFRFYGIDQSSLRVYRNGFATFDPRTYYDYYNWPIPSEYGPDGMIAPFWDNLNLTSTDPDEDGVYSYYDAAAHRMIIEWSRLRNAQPEIEGYQTFQAILLDPAHYQTATGDGEILFLYEAIANNDSLRNYATVGIESPSEDDGIEYCYAGQYATGACSLSAEMAIRLTTDPPVYRPSGMRSDALGGTGGASLDTWPNPTASPSRITFVLPTPGLASLAIFDPSGRKVRSLVSDVAWTAGPHQITWDGGDDRGRHAAPGIYFCRLESGGRSIVRKLIRLE